MPFFETGITRDENNNQGFRYKSEPYLSEPNRFE